MRNGARSRENMQIEHVAVNVSWDMCVCVHLAHRLRDDVR